MVAGIFLVTRTGQGVNSDKNQVREVIIHDDDAQTDAQIIQNCVDQLNVLNPVESKDGAIVEDAYPVGYFDVVVQVAASPEGPLATIDDMIAYAPEIGSIKT